MKTGDYVKLTAPVTGDQLCKFLTAHGSTRETDRPQNGRIHASFPIPLLPEEV